MGLGSLSGYAQSSSTSSGPTAVTATPLAPFGPDVIPAGELPLGPGDLVDVSVFNTPELSSRLRIDQTGFIDLPLGGHIKLAGLTDYQSSLAIQQYLRDNQIMLDPHVSIQAFQYVTQGISVLGEVHKPGPYPLYGPHTLYNALSLAGGPTASEGSSITITRHSDPTHPLVVPVDTPNFSELQNSTPVYPGDVIFVSTADLVYVVGDVTAPGPIAIAQGRNLSLLKVVGLCRGWTPTASVNKAIVIRKTVSGTETIPINLHAVMKNQAPDMSLKADDILVMPHSAFKAFLTYALPAAAGAALNAGAITVTRY